MVTNWITNFSHWKKAKFQSFYLLLPLIPSLPFLSSLPSFLFLSFPFLSSLPFLSLPFFSFLFHLLNCGRKEAAKDCSVDQITTQKSGRETLFLPFLLPLVSLFFLLVIQRRERREGKEGEILFSASFLLFNSIVFGAWILWRLWVWKSPSSKVLSTIGAFFFFLLSFSLFFFLRPFRDERELWIECESVNQKDVWEFFPP